jgi:hypothetical protein
VVSTLVRARSEYRGLYGLEGSYVVSTQNIAETQQDGIRTV